MENKNIIIILLVIIIILLAAIGFMLFNQNFAKEPSKIEITSEKEQYEGGKLSVQLTDLNKTPISKELVNITIINSKGKVVVDEVVKTNSKGNAKIDLDLKEGKYNVTVNYSGNENFTGNNTTQKLTIKEEVKQTQITGITYEYDPVSGGSITDLSHLSDDEFAQYLGYSDAEEMERETERKRAEAYAQNN